MKVQSDFGVILGQLIPLLPHLLVCIGGIILAAMWWRRAPRAATLMIFGLAILLLCSLASAGMTIYMINNRNNPTLGSIAQTHAFIHIALHLLRAFGLGLLVAAAFAGRPRPVGGGFEVQPAVSQV